METGHVEDNAANSLFSVLQRFPNNVEYFHLCKVFLYVGLNENPFFTECLDKYVHIRVGSEDDGLKSPMPQACL